MRQSVVMSRRRFLKHTASTAGLALGAGALTQFPFVHAAEPVTLRIAGTGVNQFKELADKCKADLGFTVQYTSLVSDDVVKRAVTQPSSFDLLDSEYWMLKKIVPSGNLRGIDVTKIKYYDNIVPIFTKGELPNGKKVAMEGIAPIKVAYLTAEKSEKFAPQPSQWMTVIPTVYNADTLGHPPRSDQAPDRILGRAAQLRIQRKISHPEHPVDRHHGCGDGVRGQGSGQLRRQRQHDHTGD
jgi:putative spermidine/putrescine transport system substrate-binding protein